MHMRHSIRYGYRQICTTLSSDAPRVPSATPNFFCCIQRRLRLMQKRSSARATPVRVRQPTTQRPNAPHGVGRLAQNSTSAVVVWIISLVLMFPCLAATQARSGGGGPAHILFTEPHILISEASPITIHVAMWSIGICDVHTSCTILQTCLEKVVV
eukprot:208276-Pleurochrysis_carterae.AAC.8